MNRIDSVSKFHRLLTLPAPVHPLVSVVSMDDVRASRQGDEQVCQLDIYSIGLKRDVQCADMYGQMSYDFQTGIMGFTGPGQKIALVADQLETAKGFVLLFHPDLIALQPLAKTMQSYSFFHYSVNEALHLSEQEERDIIRLLEKINEEASRIDQHSQEIIVSHIGLVLSYAKRFYERQFITRHKTNNELLDRFRQLITVHLEEGDLLKNGRLTVQELAAQLHLSPDYLSDMLRTHTGQNAQQHLQQMLIEKAKELLGSTSMTVAEIAYYLGFEYPQSFNKLFKSKSHLSPLQFRRNLN